MTARRLLEDGTRDVARLVVAVVAVALSAQVSVALPGTPVPQSLQALAVAIRSRMEPVHRHLVG